MNPALYKNTWVWGYVLDTIPGKCPYVGTSSCSLETAADYFGAANVVFMNPTHDLDALNDQLFAPIADRGEVLVGLTHGRYAEAAKKVSEFSLTHPNVTGAVIDDYRDPYGPSAHITAEETKEIRDALRSANPALKLWVVYYSRYDLDDLLPMAPYIDGINYWCWVSTEHYWRYQYPLDLLKMGNLKALNKPVLQGLFLHDYGDSGNAQPMELLKLQTEKITRSIGTSSTCDVKGMVILQNGWLDKPDHREQTVWLHDYLDWFHRTGTVRE